MSENFKNIRMIRFGRHDQSGNYGLLLVKSSPTREFHLHRHDFYEFEILVEGCIRHTVNGKSEVLTCGDFWCLSPDEVHSLTTIGEGVRIYNISVYLPEAAPDLCALIERFTFPSAGRLDEERLAVLAPLYELLFANAREGGENVAERVGALCEYILLSLLPLADHSLLPPVPQGAARYVKAAMETVRRDFRQPLTLVGVAATLGISPGYLSTLFSECLGSTFKDYLAATRVRHAMRLLSSTQESVTEIAYACGFGSFSAFLRTFRGLCGMTPREYRRA